MNQKQMYMGTGRRKRALARVRVMRGSGNFSVNGATVEDYFGRETLTMMVKQPLEATQTLGDFDIIASVSGGGVAGQAGALRHGIARALLSYDPNLRAPLRKGGFLTRDPRMKERKKYGQRGARARFQFSKR